MILHRGASAEEAKRRVEIFRRMVLTKERISKELEEKRRKEEEEAAEEEEDSESPSESESEHRKSPIVK